ncbi:MAG: multicopper oxidase family protein [Gammaproteobacteria bacterium]|nr:multicopper oxidase family protein [Gammaproteobacteria bacterium]
MTLTTAPGTAPLVDSEQQTAVWTYNGNVPGPVLRVRQNDEVRVRLHNQLPAGTTIHWHGIRIDNAMDGVADLTQAPVAAGDAFDYRFRVPDAGTFWYHPHFRSWEQVARGLHGLLIVEESRPIQVDQDIPLLLDDWLLDNDEQIDTARFGNMHDATHAGRLGNVLTANGKPAPDLHVRAGERLRLRLLNAANARVLTLDFDALPATIVALDGQPVVPRKLDRSRLTLAPGQRADVVTDVAPGDGRSSELLAITRGGETLAARFVLKGPPLRETLPNSPIALPANPVEKRLSHGDKLVVDLLMQGGVHGNLESAMYLGKRQSIRSLVREGKAWAFNGEVGMPRKPLFSVQRGRTVEIRMVNDTGWPHAMHFHGHHVRVAADTREEIAGDWRDTVLVQPQETLPVEFVADNPGKWMLHCHMLEHQAAGMATWFEVT